MNIAPPIQCSRFYSSDIKRVWKLVTEQSYLSQWLMPGNFEAITGHQYYFSCEPKDCDTDGKVYGEVLEVDAPNSIRFTWNNARLSKETIVVFRLEQKDQGTWFYIEHSEFAAKDQKVLEAHDGGWVKHQQMLADILES